VNPDEFHGMNPSDKSSQARNPYRPSPEIVPVSDNETPQSPPQGLPRISLAWTVIRWSLVCGIAALPSFFLGLDFTRGRYLGMIGGIATFISLYVATDLCTRFWPIRRKLVVRRTLVFVYVSRIVVSVVFPVGLFVDLMTGAVMLSFTEDTREIFAPVTTQSPINELAAFWVTYRMTVIQATLMNIVLAVWGLLTFPFIHLWTKKRYSPQV
jgi:hypothetical protein